jgi:MFS family permease
MRTRRWSLAAAITSVTVFGLSIGQSVPLLPLLLEQRGTDVTITGLNASATFIGVILGPLLTPRCVRRLGVRDFLLLCFAGDIVLFLAMKAFDSLAAWFVLRAALGLVGSAIFTASEAWINLLAGDAGRGRVIGIYGAALCAGFGIGPLLLSITGIEGWAPFLGNAAITALATIPLFCASDATRSLGGEPGAGMLRIAARAPLILGVVALFGMFEAALMALLPIWAVRSGLGTRQAAAALSTIYIGSIVLQLLVGWLSDKLSRMAALRLCGAVGLAGALALASLRLPPGVLLCLLFVWGGTAAAIYPVALSMAGDRFRGAELVTVNAAIIMAYGCGALAGPVLGGVAMDLRNPQGLPWLFAMLFAGLLSGVVGRIKAATREQV